MKGLRVVVGDHIIEGKDSLKYLGVWIGKEFRFGVHIRKTAAKTLETTKKLARLMPNLGGARENTRRLLCRVVEAQIMYAAPFWGEALRYKVYRDDVNRIQRRMALKVSSAYRTVSGPAAMVVARLLPLDLLVWERGVIAADRGRSRDDIRREVMDRWQREWEREERGAWTRHLIPDVRLWYSRNHGEVDHWLCQILTGHGAFGQYLYRFKKRETPACIDCGEVDTAEHTFFRCPRWDEERNTARRKLGGHLEAAQMVGAMISSPQKWKAVVVMARSIIRGKHEQDAERQQ